MEIKEGKKRKSQVFGDNYILPTPKVRIKTSFFLTRRGGM